MQHLEGQTLAARLEKGPLPLDQALTIAAEIADALDKAHRQGIVHRDLKPANIMLTKTGAKLLDFGLAKLTGTDRADLDVWNGAGGRRRWGRRTGTILGTVQYMAPEQVEGKEADARSDIWALGAVIYEMVTGTRPFAGDTPASVIGAILKDTPPSISTRQPVAPRALDDVVERCLAKDPDERWQSIADVGRLLQDIASNQQADPAQRAPARGTSKERIVWIAATALMCIALVYVTVWRRPVVPAGDLVRLSVNPPARMVFAAHTSATVPTPQFAVSPDGRSIAFVAASPANRPALWLRSLDDVDARVLPGTEDASEPFWSPDSRWHWVLRRTRGAEESCRVGWDHADDRRRDSRIPVAAHGAPDDTIVFGTGYGGVQRVPAAGGTPQGVTELDASKQEGSHRWPQFLPDGRHFLFTVRSGLADQRGVYVGTLDGKIKRLLDSL